MSERSLILGIESSCDDTAAAVVDASGRVVSSITVGQLEVHKPFGGVFPEAASRAHVAAIFEAITRALEDAGIGGKQLRAIAVTRGPGLIGPLLVGLNAAAGLAMGWQVPVVGVNHLRGHLRSADLEEQRLKFPTLILLVSGGHTVLAYMRDLSEIEILGSTRDDSVGEAYDKVGRVMGLGYPAGAKIDRLARTGKATIDLPRPILHEGVEFSFSGLKSAAFRALSDGAPPEDLAASFVEACMETLITKSRRALKLRPARSFAVVGGVAASPQLRERAAALCEEFGVSLCLPPLKWATDNAAMIALAGWDYIRLDTLPRPIVDPNLSMSQL